VEADVLHTMNAPDFEIATDDVGRKVNRYPLIKITTTNKRGEWIESVSKNCRSVEKFREIIGEDEWARLTSGDYFFTQGFVDWP